MGNSVNKAYTKDDAERLLDDIHNQIQHADNKASELILQMISQLVCLL